MRPLFTIHAGEVVVGDYIEKQFKGVQLWVPTKDTGVDLLVTSSRNKKNVSLQIKYSRDFLLSGLSPEFHKPLKYAGWWTLNHQKIAHSKADYWVFVLGSSDFIVIKPSKLLARLNKIHGRSKTIQIYLWVTEKGRCWETRDLSRDEWRAIAGNQYSNSTREFSKYLNDWSPIKALNK